LVGCHGTHGQAHSRSSEKQHQQADGQSRHHQYDHRLGQNGGACKVQRFLSGKRGHGHPVFPPDQFHDAPEYDGEANGQKYQHEMVLGPRWTDAEPFDSHAHGGDGGHGADQGRNHWQPKPEKAAEHEHAAQRDKIYLGEIDNAHGVVDDAEPQSDQGVDGPAGDARKEELQ
jgi:hypothetical protein